MLTSNHVCFECRIGNKRPGKCNCGKEKINIGYWIRVPKKSDIRAWKILEGTKRSPSDIPRRRYDKLSRLLNDKYFKSEQCYNRKRFGFSERAHEKCEELGISERLIPRKRRRRGWKKHSQSYSIQDDDLNY